MSTTRLAFLLLPVVFLFGCAKKEEQSAPGAAPSSIAPNVGEIASVQTRPGLAPDFSWKDPSGKTVTFDSYKGKVTLINFWATWCLPCKKELPDLIALSSELSSKNFRIIGVSTDVGLSVTEDVSAFVKEKGIPYQIVIGNDDLQSAFGNVRMLPTSFLIDADGKIIKSFIGFQTKDSFLQPITAALQ